MRSIEQNTAEVRARIRQSAEKSARRSETIELMAVSKTRSATEIRAAHGAGLMHFGENYLQEASVKIATLDDLNVVWHFIGPLQGNKCSKIARQFDWVHSLADAGHAQRLAAARPVETPAINVCIQVNISGEASKSGVSPAQIERLADTVASLPTLRLRGIMALPHNTQNLTSQREAFLSVQSLYNEIRKNHPHVDTLSIGMSQDLETAIECGSTMIRIGTAIFGSRPTKIN